MLALTEADDGRTVKVPAGETLRISLAENATTGYRWGIDRHTEHIIEALGSEPQYSARALGSGGRVDFTFRVKQTGSGEIVLKNRRSPEEDATGRRFHVRVEATK